MQASTPFSCPPRDPWWVSARVAYPGAVALVFGAALAFGSGCLDWVLR